MQVVRTRLIFMVFCFLLPAPAMVSALDIEPVFDANISDEQKAILEQKIALWEARLCCDITLTINFSNDPDLKYGQGGDIWEGLNRDNERVAIALTDQYEDDDEGRPESARIRFGSDESIDWHYGSVPVPEDKYDFWTIANHEICHAVGFTSGYPKFNEYVDDGPPRTVSCGGHTATLASGNHLDPNVEGQANSLMNPGESPPMERRTPNPLTIALLRCIWPCEGTTGVQNGSFDDPTPAPWKQSNNDTPAGSEHPWRTDGGNAGRCGHLGPINGGPPNGCDISDIYQFFDCGGPGDFCTVIFDAHYPVGAPNDGAYVYLHSNGTPVLCKIPVAAGWKTYRISAPSCSEVSLISFWLIDAGNGTTTELKIDNVASTCSENNQTNLEVVEDSTQYETEPTDPNLQDYESSLPNPIIDPITYAQDLSFVWYLDGEVLPYPFVYGYLVGESTEEITETQNGRLFFRSGHPQYDGQDITFHFYRHTDANAWMQTVTYLHGVSVVWALDPGEILPGNGWRIPDLAPGPHDDGPDTIYTAVDMDIYMYANPLGFEEGDWEVANPISEYGVEIKNGMVDGLEGIAWSTTPFVMDKSSPLGFRPSNGDKGYLNSNDLPSVPVIIAQHSSWDEAGPVCCDLSGDASNDGLVNILDITYMIDYLYNNGPAPICFGEGDLDGSLNIDILDITYLIAYLYMGGPEPICLSE